MKNILVVTGGAGFIGSHLVELLVEKGFNVTAVDFAPSAIQALEEMVVESKVDINALQLDIFSLLTSYQQVHLMMLMTQNRLLLQLIQFCFLYRMVLQVLVVSIYICND